MTELIVRFPGPFTTVQDLGRFGSQSLGVPPAGALDRDALETANRLVGNDPSEACLECTLRGPELQFTGAAAITVCGAEMEVLINGLPAQGWETLFLEAGDILSLGPAVTGLRTYISFAGGLDIPAVLGSRSTYVRAGIGGWEGRPIRAGDHIPLRTEPGKAGAAARTRLRVPEEERPAYASDLILRAIPSHEIGRFEPESVERFFQESFTVSAKTDRMGCRLEGAPLVHTRGADIISSGVQTGTVQVPGDGLPIVLLADRQTTGGYTRIAHVIQADLPRLGQARPGDRVRFERATVEDAREAWRRREARIAGRTRPGAVQAAAEAGGSGSRRRFLVRVDGRSYDVEVWEP